MSVILNASPIIRTRVTQEIESKNRRKQVAAVIDSFLDRSVGNTSRTDEMMASICTNCQKEAVRDSFCIPIFMHDAPLTIVSIPSRKSMPKNRQAHRGARGSMLIASGYVIKASPGPPVAAVATGRPV